MPTRHGWAAVAAAIGTVVSGRLFGVLELYVVGAALLAAAVVAVVLVNLLVDLSYALVDPRLRHRR